MLLASFNEGLTNVCLSNGYLLLSIIVKMFYYCNNDRCQQIKKAYIDFLFMA